MVSSSSRSATPDTIRPKCSPPTSPQLSVSTTRQHVPASAPVSVVSMSADGSSSQTPSYTASPALVPTTSSPDSLRGRISHNNPAPFEIGEPIMPYTSNSSPFQASQNTSSEGTPSNKAPGLMRRISRGAQNKIRKRQPSAHADHRDNSSGPMIMRRRSDSRSDGKPHFDSLDLAHEDVEEEEEENDLLDPLALGPLTNSPTLKPNGTFLHPVPSNLIPAAGIAPAVPPLLQKGTNLTKITKKKRKTMKFSFDMRTAKVFWNPSNPSKKFYIDDIIEIRTGPETKNYRDEFQIPDEQEKCWFTILYADPDRSKGRATKVMHLLAPNEHVFSLWTKTLESVSRYRIALMAGLAGSGHCEKALRAHWQHAMEKAHSGSRDTKELLDLGGVESLCRSLHINCSATTLQKYFQVSDKHTRGQLDYAEFKDFVSRLKERKDIKDIFRSIASNPSVGLSLTEFLEFLRTSQGVPVEAEREHWIAVFEKLVHKSKHKSQSHHRPENNLTDRVNFEAFALFLLSPANGVLLPLPNDINLDRPLNEYFISSSHNTYLTGRQVAGQSSTEPYISALYSGCRCVEIDCWDGPDGRPIVSHGHTLTTSVLFQDCVDVIGKYAFLASPYPLIISLEVHCSPDQQQKMVSIMKRSLGEALLLEPILSESTTLPSPEQLKNRILIKIKTSDNVDETLLKGDVAFEGRRRSQSSPFAHPTLPEGIAVPNGFSLSLSSTVSPADHAMVIFGPAGRSMTSVSSATEDNSEPVFSRVASKKDTIKKKPRSNIIKSLADLGVYTRGQKWTSFAAPESKTFNHVFSFAERTFNTMCKNSDTKTQLEWHNIRFLARVYPSNFRLRSSNFDPNIYWRRGVQMVALNWQTYDVGMQMNEAMFASGTDRTGYVLKPKELRQSRHCFDLPREFEASRFRLDKKLVKFSLELISAQQLPRSRGIGMDESFNPYVEIEMFSAEDKTKGIVTGEGGKDASARNGMSGIGSPHRRRTRIVLNNGYNPVFHDEFKLSLETKYPSLVFVRWSVWNSSDGKVYNSSSGVPLAIFTAKLSSLQEGYHHIPLYDGNGDQYLFSTLFCKIHKEPASSPIRENLREMQAERVGIFRQIGNSVRRTLSVERKTFQDDS